MALFGNFAFFTFKRRFFNENKSITFLPAILLSILSILCPYLGDTSMDRFRILSIRSSRPQGPCIAIKGSKQWIATLRCPYCPYCPYLFPFDLIFFVNYSFCKLLISYIWSLKSLLVPLLSHFFLAGLLIIFKSLIQFFYLLFRVNQWYSVVKVLFSLIFNLVSLIFHPVNPVNPVKKILLPPNQ